MANVSSSNSLEENIPKLRFPEFEGEWTSKTLSEIANYRKEKATFNKNLYISTENMQQQFEGIERYSNTNIISGNLFCIGDILLANIRPYLKKVWMAEFEGCCNSDVLVLKTTKEILSNFLYYIIANDNFINYVMTAVKGSKMPRGDKEHIMRYPTALPTIPEQKKISLFISLIENKIKIQRQLIKSLKLYKRGLLLKLFPQKGETAPQYRFKGFTNTWEQRKLREIIVDYSEKNPINEDLPVLTSSRKGIQTQEEHFGSTQKHDTTDYNVIPKGYCTYRNRSDDKSFTFNVNDCIERGIVSKFYPVFSVDKGNAKFLTTYLNSNETIRKRLAVLSVGTSQVVLSMTQLKELELLIPSKAEQDKIGGFLYEFDNLITFHQEKCYSYEKIKSVLLQQMFI